MSVVCVSKLIDLAISQHSGKLEIEHDLVKIVIGLSNLRPLGSINCSMQSKESKVIFFFGGTTHPEEQRTSSKSTNSFDFLFCWSCFFLGSQMMTFKRVNIG